MKTTGFILSDYHYDVGAILAFLKENKLPVVILLNMENGNIQVNNVETNNGLVGMQGDENSVGW